MTHINVDFNSLGQAVEDVRASHARLLNHRDELDTYLNNLRGAWGGGAGMSWQQVQANWSHTADQVHQILANLHGALDVSLSNYGLTENQLTRLWEG
jgi:WXG100 family type VII secretion target